jgi:hypothetical protein
MPLYTRRTAPGGDFWEQNFTKRYITTAATWADITRCMEALSARGSAKFSALHRCEGGFMCTHDVDFESTEPTSGGATPLHCVRKAIRFDPCFSTFWVDWPSLNFELLEVDEDHVVIPPNKVISLRFEGHNCRPWTKRECDELADVIATSLQWTRTRRRT